MGILLTHTSVNVLCLLLIIFIYKL
jgi:hypothetical protein